MQAGGFIFQSSEIYGGTGSCWELELSRVDRGLSSEMFAIVRSLGLTILFGYWLFVRWPNDNDPDHVAKFASLIVASLLTMSYRLIYDLLLIIPVIAFTFGVAPRGAKAFVLAVHYCAPTVYFFLGSSAINWIPLALGWLFIVMDRALAESYGDPLAVAQKNGFSY